MKPVPRIRKRGGDLVEFDESKIADAIYKAALSVGGEDRFLAEELASVVTLFLEKTYLDAIPTIEDVQDMVERVLIETGHARTAKAYILYREKRARVRETQDRPQEPRQRELFEPGPLVLLDAPGDLAVAAPPEFLARRLEAEANLPRDVAMAVALRVVERARALMEPSLSASLLGKLVDAELLARGLIGAVRERGDIAVAGARLHAGLFPKEKDRSGTPADRVSAFVLRQYSLEQVLPERVAAAHLEGRIRVSGLDRPTALFAASITTEALRGHGIPGLSGRFGPGAVANPRRFTAFLGRAIRSIAPHFTDGLALSRLNLLTAPLLGAASRDDLREEAWHLLSELAGLPQVEIDLGLGPAPLLASRKARGPDGGTMRETYRKFAGTSMQFASAFLEVRGTGAGLGPRSSLPRLVLTLGSEAISSDEGKAVIARAVGEAMAREPVLIVFDREDLPLLGTSRARIRLEDAGRLTDTATLSVVMAGRVVVNLPRAAYRAGVGNSGSFLREVEAAGEIAIEALRVRARFLKRCGAAPDGPLAPLVRERGDTPRLLDLERAAWSVAVLGLNEAVAHVLGEELHESDEAVKLGQKALGLLTLLCRRAGGDDLLQLAVDAEEDPAVTAGLAMNDRAEHPAVAARIPPAYTPGVALRAGAPVDLAVRLETEGRLSMALRTSTVSCLMPGTEHPAAETVISLLEKTWSNTRIRQLLLGRLGAERRTTVSTAGRSA